MMTSLADPSSAIVGFWCSTRSDLLHVMMNPEWISELTDFPVCLPSRRLQIRPSNTTTNTPTNRTRSQISSIPIAFVAFTRTERVQCSPLQRRMQSSRWSGLQDSYIMTVNNRVTMRAAHARFGFHATSATSSGGPLCKRKHWQ
jgi:hypothetical protein